MTGTNRRQLLILAFTLVVVTLGFGLVMPIIPFYMELFGAGGTELGLLVASYAVMRLIFGPIWGSLSDRVGRKPILMIGVLGYGITMIGFGLATQLWMMFAARILAGILSSATAPTTMAYISDSTSEEDRGGGMGLLGAAGGLGAIFGPAVGGLLAEHSLSLPFFVAAGMSFLALILVILLLPESLPQNDQSTKVADQPIFDLRSWWQALFTPIGPLLVLTFLVTGGLMIFYGILGLYALERFGYGTSEVGVIFTVLGLVSATGQGLLVGPLTKRFGDSKVIKVGFLLSAVTLLPVMLAGQFVPLLITVGVFSLANALLIPALTSLTSKRTTLDQGVTMGLSNSFVSLGRIFGPTMGGLVFDLHWGLPFVTGSALMLIGFLLSLRWVRKAQVVQPIPRSTSE
ncbi:MAG: MFS transporter [Anaerolineales bacterium]|jgi:DHA1 family multidrug resistance protein-like MFS transporter